METINQLAEWAQHFNGLSMLLLFAVGVYMFVAWDARGSGQKKEKAAKKGAFHRLLWKINNPGKDYEEDFLRRPERRPPSDLKWSALREFLCWQSTNPDKDYADWVIELQENGEDLPQRGQ